MPTRDNLHDAYNAVIWLRFPRSKAVLNRLQAEALREALPQAGRGRVRDWATHWDEMGLILACEGPEVAARLHRQLEAHDWRGLLVEPAGRRRWGQTIQPVPFGHALLERLLPPAMPFKSLTAKCWVMEVPGLSGWIEWDRLDDGLARGLEGALPRLLPLPVMGIPGWTSASEVPAFYEDEQVFRKRR